METFLVTAVFSFFACLIGVPIMMGLARMFGIYAIVEESTCHVYVLFGTVVGCLREPGFYFLPGQLGLSAFVVRWIGQRYVLDMRMDQAYLRSQAVNSEEGAPMGIGIWYEMYISDPVSYIFKNTDPAGSLAANVSNATVRCLSNMKLEDMLEDRHTMSQTVRAEVSEKSHEWGYRLGSVYVRKVHFRDQNMIKQIESKVVNRLRQVTSAIRQDGSNQVNIIASTAERQAAIEFAKAQAVRPSIVGGALGKITADPEISTALFEILETQTLVDAGTKVTLIPGGTSVDTQVLVASGALSRGQKESPRKAD